MAKELIKSLGGAKAVAEALNVSPSAVANWMMPDRDVPWRHRHAVARVAAQQGVTLPENFWQPAPAERAEARTPAERAA